MDTTINITCPQSGCQISIHISIPENATNTKPTIEVVDNQRPVDSGVRPTQTERPVDSGVRPSDPPVRPSSSGGRIDAPAGKNSYDTSDESDAANQTPYRNVRRPRN
ncbi:MAG: hypothetical protein PHP31_03090 [Lentimicrobiaceae bacterium]|nr:hypothetical protein [Lentimicrobiaceae bacterium]